MYSSRTPIPGPPAFMTQSASTRPAMSLDDGLGFINDQPTPAFGAVGQQLGAPSAMRPQQQQQQQQQRRQQQMQQQQMQQQQMQQQQMQQQQQRPMMQQQQVPRGNTTVMFPGNSGQQTAAMPQTAVPRTSMPRPGAPRAQMTSDMSTAATGADSESIRKVQLDMAQLRQTIGALNKQIESSTKTAAANANTVFYAQSIHEGTVLHAFSEANTGAEPVAVIQPGDWVQATHPMKNDARGNVWVNVRFIQPDTFDFENAWVMAYEAAAEEHYLGNGCHMPPAGATMAVANMHAEQSE